MLIITYQFPLPHLVPLFVDLSDTKLVFSNTLLHVKELFKLLCIDALKELDLFVWWG